MTEPEIFSLNECPLEGSTLIEASAGTGKTYAIAGLFIRLLLEKRLEVSQILVMTFTEAATAELRDRVRSKIREALAAFSGGPAEDSFIRDIVASRTDPAEARNRLLRALRTFDQAAIFTIHGFCRRVLRDRAFESGGLFDTELITDQEDLKREIVEDFWRKTLSGASPLLVHFALNRKFFPGDLLSLLPGDTARWNLEVLPREAVPETAGAEQAYGDAFRDVARSWGTDREEVSRLLGHEGLKKNMYSESRVRAWLSALQAFLDSDGNDPDAASAVGPFTTTRIEAALKKGAAFPGHPFFSLCDGLRERAEALLEAFGGVLLGWKRALILGVDDGLMKRKAERNVQSFDDLLTRFLAALGASGGESLARPVRERFRAALIDEFQDTDPIQYGIFRTLFGEGRSTLFLIGDPKQAIYGFRGADIFTYLAAASEVDRRYTLDRNWRSTPRLVRAVNTLFSRAARPFLFEGIAFHPVKPGRAGEEGPGTAGGPLRIWFLPASDYREDGRAMAKEDARRIVSRGVALEIRRLLREEAPRDGKAGFREGDVAVLVRTNREARIVQEELRRLGLRGILYSTGNIFETREALEMERILRAVADPEREGAIRVALATDVFGFSAGSLWAALEDEEAWNGWTVRFREYRDRWYDRGFIAMFRQVLDREGGILRLMAFPDGERRVTNLLHLSEILHGEEAASRRSPPQLIKWLSGKRAPGTPDREEDLMRLESDEDAVRIVTIHKSKGLQYPVVFCPFQWEGLRDRKTGGPVFFHDRGKGFRPVLDLGSAAWHDHGILAEEEERAELLRLFYVAVTRARERCYVVWGSFRSGDTSAPSWLLHGGRPASDEELRGELERLQSRAPDAIALSGMPAEEGNAVGEVPGGPPRLARRTFTGTVDATWRLASFSSLVSDDPHGPETADRDGTPAENRPEGLPVAERGVDMAASFPRGTKGGVFFHDLLEHYDFKWENEDEPERLVAEKLRDHGFDLSWKGEVLAMMRRVLALPMDPRREDFTLARIPVENRLNELEFYFPLKKITAPSLRRLFQTRVDFPGPAGLEESLGRLRFSVTRGFLKGFMDLVFLFEGKYYLVDWKSNFLGQRTEDYGLGPLTRAMVENRYVLQYTLYTVALHRYLALRLPGYDYGTHFGGIRYIFLRGVDPAKGSDYGIFRDKPPGMWIETLCDALLDFPGGGPS